MNKHGYFKAGLKDRRMTSSVKGKTKKEKKEEGEIKEIQKLAATNTEPA
jgi:hypothetical protein